MSQNKFKLFWEGVPEAKRKIYRHIFNVWWYVFAAVIGVGINSVSEKRWPVILLFLFGLGVFISIVIYDYEKPKNGKLYLFLRPWFLLIIFAVSALTNHYSTVVNCQATIASSDIAHEEQIRKLRNYYNQKINTYTNLIAIENQKRIHDEFEIQTVSNRGKGSQADILSWSGVDSFPDNFTNCAYFLKRAFSMDIADQDRAQNYPLYAFSEYKLNSSPDAYESFETNLDSFIGELKDHKADKNQYEFLSERGSLAACEGNLKRIRELMPADKKAYLDDKIKTVQVLETFCNH